MVTDAITNYIKDNTITLSNGMIYIEADRGLGDRILKPTVKSSLQDYCRQNNIYLGLIKKEASKEMPISHIHTRLITGHSTQSRKIITLIDNAEII